MIFQAWELWEKGNWFDLIDDKSIIESSGTGREEVMRCIQVGLICVQDHAADRPTMSNVVLMLSREIELPKPREPTFTFQRMLDCDFQSQNYNDDVGSLNEVTISVMEAR